MSMKPLTKQQLTAIAFENVRNFGPVDDDVARDTGITPVEDMQTVVADALENQKIRLSAEKQTKKETAAPYIGAFMCGDCLVDIKPGQSCGHVRIDAKGNRHIIG